MYIITDRCVLCSVCADECPVGCISEGETQYVINQDDCITCGTCQSVCPNEAIDLK